jgi:CRP-like cAMP-binding protein
MRHELASLPRGHCHVPEAVFEELKLALTRPPGTVADAIFYIHKGKIKLTVVSNRGKEAVVAILGAGEFFGEGFRSLHHAD